MPRTCHLPPGTKLAPGTPVKITHSDCKGKQIHENATVLADGVSTKSSLPPKLLINMKISWWNVYYTPPEPAQQKIYYHGGVSTRSLCLGKRCIALCNKSGIPIRERHKYASCAGNNHTKSLVEAANTPPQGRTQQPIPAEPQPSTSSADQQEAAVPQPTSSSQTAPTPKHKTSKRPATHKIRHLPPGVKLPPGTPVRIAHCNGKGKQINETSIILANGISTRSSLPVKLLVNMRISWWNVYYAPSGPGQQKIHYRGGVSTKSLCLGKKCISLYRKSHLPGEERYKYASCASCLKTKSLAETINAPQDSSQPIPAEPQPSTSSAGQQEAAVPQPTSSNQTAPTPK